MYGTKLRKQMGKIFFYTKSEDGVQETRKSQNKTVYIKEGL